MYVKVVVDVVSSNTDELFTYKVPELFEECIYVGSRVYVEFGFRKILGYVIEIVNETDFQGTIKEILEVIDFEQGLTKEQIDLALTISKDTKSFLTSCLDLMYPSFMKSKVRKYLNVYNYNDIDAELALLFGFKKKVLVTNDVLTKYNKIKKEIDKGNIDVTTDIYTYGKNKLVKYYRINSTNLDVKSKIRKEVLSFISVRGEASKEEIKDFTGCSDIILKKLVDENYLKVTERFPIDDFSTNKSHKIINYNSSTIYLKEKYQRLSGKPFVLYSNDEEFKLDFYLDCAIETIGKDKKVLICTPTILSNSIIYNYFNRNLKGYRIVNFNSRLSNNEYYYNYNNVRNGNVDIVICTKSSIFLPLSDIGLIIMVDEDSQHYLNEQNPKFNTIDVLKFRANYHNCKFLLSSSALSVASYYNHFTAKYFMLEYIIPSTNNIKLINMRNELEDLLLSRELRIKLKEKLDSKQISMLILNNLGYSTTIICDDCGRHIKCPKCKVSLVYHREKNVYKCPYCNLQLENIKCECGSTNFKMLGYGLEKLNEKLLSYYPNIKIIQVDSTTMSDKSAYDDFLLALEEKDVDIIIGTNILTNINSNDIHLVGIINADSILNMGDYRSSEVAFNTVSKIKNFKDCDIIIQGYNLDHYAITKATQNNLDFYNLELDVRKNYNYPPFIEVNKLQIIGDYKDIYYYANYFKKVFSRVIGGDILGPVYLPKVKGVQLMIKHNDFSKLSNLIDEVNNKFKENKLIVNFERYPTFY